LYILKII